MLRNRVLVIAATIGLAVLVVAIVLALPNGGLNGRHRPKPSPTLPNGHIGPAPSSTAPTAGPHPAAAPAAAQPHRMPVKLDVPGGFAAWAYATQGGFLAGSPNAGTERTTTESMVKAWIAADALRTGTADPAGTRLTDLSLMIRDSDNEIAERLYRAGGGTAVIQRMIDTCGLVNTQAVPGWWSQTQITARDAAQLGTCIADGSAAGGHWTPWLLDQMRQVRGPGRFGIVDALPRAGLAIKNGWNLRDDGQWHVNCLAIGPGWTLAVLLRYPADRGLDAGADACASVTRQLRLTG